MKKSVDKLEISFFSNKITQPVRNSGVKISKQIVVGGATDKTSITDRISVDNVKTYKTSIAKTLHKFFHVPENFGSIF